MRLSHTLIVGAACASVVGAGALIARSGPLAPPPGPVSSTGVTLTDLANLVMAPAMKVEGTGNNYWCLKDGIVNPESIPTGGGDPAITPLRGFGNIPGAPGTSVDEMHPDWIIVDSAQEQMMVDADGNVVRKPLRIRAFRDRSIIGLLRKMRDGEVTPDMTFEFTMDTPNGPVVVERITLKNATVCNITCSPDRRTYIAEFKSEAVMKTIFTVDPATGQVIGEDMFSDPPTSG